MTVARRPHPIVLVALLLAAAGAGFAAGAWRVERVQLALQRVFEQEVLDIRIQAVQAEQNDRDQRAARQALEQRLTALRGDFEVHRGAFERHRADAGAAHARHAEAVQAVLERLDALERAAGGR